MPIALRDVRFKGLSGTRHAPEGLSFSRGVPSDKPRHCVARPRWNTRNDPTNLSVKTYKTDDDQDDQRLSSRRVRCRPKSKYRACAAIRPNRSPVSQAIIARLELR